MKTRIFTKVFTFEHSHLNPIPALPQRRREKSAGAFYLFLYKPYSRPLSHKKRGRNPKRKISL
jgi:hypothetical protein